MKSLFFLTVLLIAGIPQAVFGQNATPSELALERAAEFDRSRALNAKIVNIIENQELLLKRQQELDQRLSRLSQEIDTLREGRGQASANFVTRDELKLYVDKIKEIDEKREADKALFLKSLRDMEKLLLVPAPSPATSGSAPNDGLYFEYKVQSNDNLSRIVAAYNEQFKIDGLKTIDISQVEAINPGLDPDRIVVGQVIKIPAPDKR